MPAFVNYWVIGPQNQDFSFSGVAKTLANGLYTAWAVLDDFLDKIQITTATIRLSLSSTGHLTIDNNGGANFTIAWTDTAFRDLLGFTADLAAANAYTGARRIRGSLYLEHGGGPLAATIGEWDPQPELASVVQTRSLGGVKRTTRSGVVTDSGQLVLQYLDNTARYVSPSAAVGTTYAAAGATELGLTMATHARDCWWDSTVVGSQGWSDGRPVQYHATSPSITASAAPTMPTATSTWVMDGESCKRWGATKARPPLTTLYGLTVQAEEYVAP